jgi:hypothetical protein
LGTALLILQQSLSANDVSAAAAASSGDDCAAEQSKISGAFQSCGYIAKPIRFFRVGLSV